MYQKFVKRIFDIIISLIALVLLTPLLIPIMLILWATGEHFVFYGQQRLGHQNRYFKIWKFATMLKNSPNLGTGSITLRKDPRVLPVGGFLRRTKINELPQLFNVLIGNMTFVGPRPLMEVDYKKFSHEIQQTIYLTKPGLTGIASVVFRDEEKIHSNSNIDPHLFDQLHIAPYKGALEEWYRQNCSIYTDLMILILTMASIFTSDAELPHKVFKDLPKVPKILKLYN